MTRTTRAPTIFGAILMLAGSLLYLVDMDERASSPHWFLIPAVVLLGLGALFAVLGSGAGSHCET